jgi:hypothetical protein
LASPPDGSVVVVIGVRARVIAIYRADGEILGTAQAGVGPTHVVAGQADLFYVADTQGDAILTFAYTGRGIRQVARVGVPGTPYGLAFDDRRGRLYVTVTETNQLRSFRVNGAGLIPDQHWTTPRQPNSVAVDNGGRVYVAGAADGVIQVLQP